MRESPGERKGIVVTDIRWYTNTHANAADLFTILAEKESTSFTSLLRFPISLHRHTSYQLTQILKEKKVSLRML